MRVVLSSCRDPWLNLALENLLLLYSASEDLLLLWQSKRAVVIGRNQNIWCEISPHYLRAHHITAVRRESGGGAVYHDHGNLNFAFFSPRARYQLERNFNFLIATLHSMGIKAKAAGNSIMVGGHKISGSAFRFGRRSVMHHGTLLINANTAHLQRVLKPENHIKENTAVHSRRASVVNIATLQRMIHVKGLQAHLIERAASWQPEGGDHPPPIIEKRDELSLRGDASLQAQAHRLQSWEWLVGRSPRCIVTLESPKRKHPLYLHLTINWGIIESLALDSPLIIRREIEEALRKSLIGRRIDNSLSANLQAHFAPLAKTLPWESPYLPLLQQLMEKIRALIIPTAYTV